MSNYDGIDRLSPGDEDLLRADARDQARGVRPTTDGCWGCTGSQKCSGTCAKPAACVFCGGPNDNQSGACVRCEVVAERRREWDEGAA